MSKLETEGIDSQFMVENISFLDNCFDNSFALQSSLQTVKEYAEEQTYENVANRPTFEWRKRNLSSQNKTALLDNTKSSQIVSHKDIINRKLKDWGLPPEIAKKYEERGISEMFEWQVTCLGNSKVLFDCCNLVYSAPTSAGKTLVAEIITIKTVLERQKKVIIILPFVSIVREKMFYLRDILSSSGIRIEGFMGSQSPPGGLQAVHVAVCTIEKANSLVNRLLDEGNISELGAIVVDELHLLGDPHRGYILELLLTKIKYVTSMSDDVQIQIVGMSATLPNLEILANWLNAELFITQFRPIPLDEYCLVGNKYYDKNGTCVNVLEPTLNIDGDNVLKICLETIRDGCSVLIFCMTKNWCESLAQALSMSFYKLGCGETEFGSVLRTQLRTESISEVLEQLKNCPVGLDQVLMKTISFGVSYHHAGLTFDERDIIEGGFKSGALRVLVATSTLSSGVNLPARKVIIRSPVFQRQPINILTYKQMIGRAGRMGKDSKGESILICTEAEKKIGFDLMMGALDPVRSCIESEDKYMRAVLEMIASQVLCTKEELDLYSKCTLLFTQQDTAPSQNFLLENTLEELKNFELVRVQLEGDEERYVATALGKACLSSSMAPNDGLSLFCELQKARQCLVLETDLHLIYLVTPYSVSSQWGEIDWLHLLTLWESLTKAMKRVGELVGVQESFIIRCLRGSNKQNNIQSKVNVHKRFYTALALQDLVNEVPLSEVAAKFQCARGFLQSLQQGAATFAGMVTAFCRQLGWKNMEMLISQFQDRLHFGIHSDLLELMRLPSLNGMRARTLFDAGFETISSIASADAYTIENVLYKAVPFQSEKAGEGDDMEDVRKRNKIKSIWITGCCGVTMKEAAQNLVAEARKYLIQEIGVAEIKWESKVNEDLSDKASTNTNEDIFVIPIVNKLNKNNVSNVDNTIGNGIVNFNHVSKNPPQVIQSLETSLVTSVAKKANENSSVIGNDFFARKCENSQMKSSTRKTNNNENVVTNKGMDIKVEDVRAESKGLESNNGSVGNSPCLSIKDDIVWDSLNFTDAALDHITNLRTSDKMFSPNISFGEIEEKSVGSDNITSSKCTSSKDISLFSSEGDNSSLFEESLPIDLIPSKLLDKEPTILCKQESASDYLSIHSNTIMNAFKSTLIEIEDDEDIKLVYEDDKVIETNLINGNEEIEIITRPNSFSSPYKRRKEVKELQPVKKKKTSENISQKTLLENNFSFVPKMKCVQSKKFTIEFLKYTMNCFLLRGDDIVNNLYIIERMKDASAYFIMNKSASTSNETIGSNIANIPKPVCNNEIRQHNCLINGMALYLNLSTCIFLDITSLNSVISVANTIRAWLQKKTTSLKILCSKTANFLIKRWLDINLSANCIDVSLIEWLIHNEEKVPHIDCLVKKYSEIDFSNISLKINNQQKRYKHLDISEASCIKAWSIWMIAQKQQENVFENFKVIGNVIDTEKQVSKILANCEHYGITVDKDLASRLLIDVRNSQETLQKKAYKLCGYHFNFNSSKDVAKVLGIYNGRRVSTKKSVLSSHNSPMSNIVIYWRKLNSILTKTLYPLTEKACIYSEGDRINPSYTMFTCTGRISMHEPNLQNVPRTFSIPLKYLTQDNTKSDDLVEFNCRNIFKAARGYIIVSADYCQLEMRILTHLSKDPVLMEIMNSNVDVFKSIAASWSNTPEDEVDDDLRQKAKQLCYGIIYGMGNRTLSQHLDVSEIEAAMFMDTFYKTYPAVKLFTQEVIEDCKTKGYVETLTKRRRYLPDIKSNIASRRSAAERQAVNTTIQGSAADIAKAAMCAIDTRTESLHPKPRLILQMHDELIYEVPEQSKQSFMVVMKEVMEGTMRLRVPLPVKVKCGYTWGDLKEVTL